MGVLLRVPALFLRMHGGRRAFGRGHRHGRGHQRGLQPLAMRIDWPWRLKFALIQIILQQFILMYSLCVAWAMAL